MADWSRLLTKEDVLSARLRVIPSKLMPKSSFKVGAGEYDVVTGAEFSRRVNHPENITSVAVLSQWFNLGHRAVDVNGRHHTMKEMTRLIKLVRVEHNKQPHQYSPFTLLTEGDVNRMAVALPKLASIAVDESAIRGSLSQNQEIGPTSTQRLAAFENTRLVLDAAHRELQQSSFNSLTHDGVSIVKAVLDIVKSVLPR
ncbi:Hypothetical predicted protein [Mytilus galloprovincialis]|uniref:Uncharacterized protein n=1 Tax=Mytilus galloprovincialis TaxID=29158 RepID=A0A8B6BRH4_MYTGA|nr:Hypothetical predicted protein [Mytilus galloprovincialis]